MVLAGQRRTEKYKAYEAANRVEARLKKEGHDPPRASPHHYQRVGRAIFDEGGDISRDDPFRQRFDRFPSKHVQIGYRDAQNANAMMDGVTSPVQRSTRLSTTENFRSPYAPSQAPQTPGDQLEASSSSSSDFQDAKDVLTEASQSGLPARKVRTGNVIDIIAKDISRESSTHAEPFSRPSLATSVNVATASQPVRRQSSTTAVTSPVHHEPNRRSSVFPEAQGSSSWPIISFPARDIRKHARQLAVDTTRVQSTIESMQAQGDDSEVLDCFDSLAGSTAAFIEKTSKLLDGELAAPAPLLRAPISTVVGTKRSHDDAFGRTTTILPTTPTIELSAQVQAISQSAAVWPDLTSSQRRILADPELGATKKAILLLICEVDPGQFITSTALIDIVHALDGKECGDTKKFRVITSRKKPNSSLYRECKLCQHEHILHEILWYEMDDFAEVPLHRVRWQDRSWVALDSKLQWDFHALAHARGWHTALQEERTEQSESESSPDGEQEHEQDVTRMSLEILASVPLLPCNGDTLVNNMANWKARHRVSSRASE